MHGKIARYKGDLLDCFRNISPEDWTRKELAVLFDIGRFLIHDADQRLRCKELSIGKVFWLKDKPKYKFWIIPCEVNGEKGYEFRRTELYLRVNIDFREEVEEKFFRGRDQVDILTSSKWMYKFDYYNDAKFRELIWFLSSSDTAKSYVVNDWPVLYSFVRVGDVVRYNIKTAKTKHELQNTRYVISDIVPLTTFVQEREYLKFLPLLE